MGRSRGGELACAGRHWSASLIHLQRARPRRPVPFVVRASDSASQSRPEALDSCRVGRRTRLSWSRRLCWFARCNVILGRARRRRVEGRGSSARLVEDAISGLRQFYAGSPNGLRARGSRMTTGNQKTARQSAPHARRSTNSEASAKH